MIEQYSLIIAGISCFFAVTAYLFKLYRIYRRVTVNCWFCNTNTTVEYQFSNSFVCPSCEQYNGFKEDGDYNCIIPGQYSGSNKYLDNILIKNSKLNYSKFDNGFCETCNLNQALKIRALAEFSAVSSDDEDDDDEVEKFKERLEEIYGLCQHCQAILSQTLGKQSSWLKPLLISWRILQSKKRLLNTKSSRTLKESLKKLIYILSLLVCFILCLLSLEKYRPGVLKVYIEEFEQNGVNFQSIYTILSYTGIVLHCFFILLQSKLEKLYTLISFVGWFAILCVLKLDFIKRKNTVYLQFPLNLSNFILIFWITRKVMQVPLKSVKTNGGLKKIAKSVDSTFISDADVADFSLKDDSFSSANESFEQQSSVKNEFEQKDLDAELLSLKISTPKKCDATNFSPQNLFKGNSNSKPKINNGSILQPSKFGKHFITQSSWVAGGYWGSPGSPQRGRLTKQNVSYLEEVKPKPVFSLSRSSSQSSGFVSQFSECPSSRSQNTFQTLLTKQAQSQKSSLSGDYQEKGTVYSLGRGIGSGASNKSIKNPQLETVEVQSACSASSYYSDNSQLRRRPPSRSSSCCHDYNQVNYVSDLDAYHRHNMNNNNSNSNIIPSYFNLGIAFFLGISVTANLFLVFILWHNNVVVQ